MSDDDAAAKNKRKTRFRIIAIVVWAAVMAGALAYMTAGSSGTPTPPAVRRCQISVTAKSVTVDGRETNIQTAPEVCKRAGGGAEIYVGSDARRTDVLQLQGVLTNARIDVLTHGLK